MGSDATILVFVVVVVVVVLIFSLKPALSLSSFAFIKRLFSSSFSVIRVVLSALSEVVDFSPTYFDSSL